MDKIDRTAFKFIGELSGCGIRGEPRPEQLGFQNGAAPNKGVQRSGYEFDLGKFRHCVYTRV